MMIMGAADAGRSDIKADEECSAIVKSSAFSKIDRNVRSWRWAAMSVLSVPSLVFASYIIILAIAFFTETSISPRSTDVLFQYNLYRQMPVDFHHGVHRGETHPYSVSFTQDRHYHLPSAEDAENLQEHLLLYNKQTVDFEYTEASQNIFSVYALTQSLGGKQISFCQSNVFAGAPPQPCTRSHLYDAPCSGPLATCSATLCKDCDEKLNYVTFSFDAHSENHIIPESWPKKRDLNVDIVVSDSKKTALKIDTSDSVYGPDSTATLSLPKLKAPFALNASTLTLYEGVVEDSDVESIAYSVVSALLFSIWVFSTAQKTDDNKGISDVFLFKGGGPNVDEALCDSIINDIEKLQIVLLFNTTVSIAIASLVALAYELYNDTVYSYVSIEMAIIFSKGVQTTVIVLYTALGVIPALITGPIFLCMLKSNYFTSVVSAAQSLTGYTSESRRPYLLVLLRLTLEIQLICAFQIHVPPSAGIPFQNTVALALGTILLTIIGRDLTLLFYGRQFAGPLWMQIISWALVTMAIMYCATAMITPILWSTQIADHTDILALSAALTSCTLLLGTIMASTHMRHLPNSPTTLEKPVAAPAPRQPSWRRKQSESQAELRLRL